MCVAESEPVPRGDVAEEDVHARTGAASEYSMPYQKITTWLRMLPVLNCDTLTGLVDFYGPAWEKVATSDPAVEVVPSAPAEIVFWS